jgi:alkyl sulfatase BDS1-like metallo-beta-lactamase superfamily hydrolase
LQDGRWIESKNAEILLDVHGPTLKGEDAVRDAVQRALDQVQLIHDQTLRQIAHGRDARQAAEQVYMPRHQRGDWENYGQVESHVRQVYNGTMGWFGGDVYDINPLSGNEEAARTVQLMGGPAPCGKPPPDANAQGGLANWRWTLKLTSLLLELDPADAEARKLRAAAARQLGQRTSSANARGWYLTEALQIEGGMQFKGQPLTVDAIRRFLGTPTAQALVAASVDENLQFVRYLVDPRKAEGLRQTFTLAVEGDPRIRRLELRNSVLVITDADAAAPTHLALTRQELAAFVLGTRSTSAADALSQLDRVLDRSHLMPPGAVESVMKGMKATGDFEHWATTQTGVEVTVELEDGELIVIIQAADEVFNKGDSVRVLRRSDGGVRVIQ